MRLATLNILHGRSLGDGAVAAERLAAACVSLEADVICLQEVDRNQTRSGSRDQTAMVAEALDAPWWRFAPALVGEPGGTWRAATDADQVTDEAAYGVGLVSRREVQAWSTVHLPAAPVKAPVAVPGGRGRFILLADEPRVCLAGRIGLGGMALTVATTHLSFVPGYNLSQLRRLTSALGRHPAAVLAGDLNLPGLVVRPAAAMAGWRSWSRQATYPAGAPRLQIDHVLSHGAVRIDHVAVVELELSDHRAVVVDVGVVDVGVVDVGVVDVGPDRGGELAGPDG